MRKLILIVTLVAALAVPSTAFAQDSGDGYSNVAGITSGNGPSSTVTTTNSSLPFTGLDLGIVLGAGVLLLGAGLVLRRYTGARQDA